MNIGYSYWGFLGDYKEDTQGKPLSTPDGNASYSWSIIYEAINRGHEVYLMQEDRDWPASARLGIKNFQSFSRDKRFTAYSAARKTLGHDFPHLDLLLLEWRFPIPGRNTPLEKAYSGFQPDLERQENLIEYYGRLKTPIIIFDLDHKITYADEAALLKAYGPIFTIFETSVRPLQTPIPRVRVEIPFVIDDLLQRPLQPVDPKRKLVYVGSRYERDDVIEHWIKPLSDRWPQEIEFFGNWTADYNFDEVKAKWPNVKYMDRISMKDFDKAYATAVACPLIAKSSYLQTGFITARLWEALLFGTLPLGLSVHHGIDQYLPAELIAKNPDDLAMLVQILSSMSYERRQELHRRVVEKIRFMDVSHFLDKLESVQKGK